MKHKAYGKMRKKGPQRPDFPPRRPGAASAEGGPPVRHKALREEQRGAPQERSGESSRSKGSGFQGGPPRASRRDERGSQANRREDRGFRERDPEIPARERSREDRGFRERDPEVPARERSREDRGFRQRDPEIPVRERSREDRSFRGPHLDDARFEARAAERQEAEILSGWHAVHEALRAGTRPIGRIFLANDRHDGRAAEITRLAKDAKIPVARVPVEALRRLVPGGIPHQGIVAEVAPKAYADPDQLLENVDSRTLFIVLDEVQDPRNLGAVLRTAAAVGAHGVFLPVHRSAGLTAAAARTAAGGAESVPVARVPNLGRLLEALAEREVLCVGLDPRANELYTRIPGDRAIALVLGSEERGLRPSIRQGCELLVKIPLPGKVESLNVSVAAGIALYETLRSRSQAG